MRTIATSLTLVSITLAACVGDSPTAPASKGSAAPRYSRAEAPADRSRPIQGRCQSTFSAPPVPPTPVFQQTDIGVCQISHLGKTRVVSVLTINFLAGTQTGQRIFTAANGDRLYASNVGTSALIGPARIGFSATLTFTGGTGRFENASGQATATGEANLATRTTSSSFIGSIAYDASDRGKKSN